MTQRDIWEKMSPTIETSMNKATHKIQRPLVRELLIGLKITGRLSRGEGGGPSFGPVPSYSVACEYLPHQVTGAQGEGWTSAIEPMV
jgi:hypothetical protein